MTASHWSEWPSSKNLQTIDAGEGVEKREIPYIVSTNANWLQPLWRTVWGFLKKLTIELSYDPAIPVLGIYMQMKTLI